MIRKHLLLSEYLDPEVRGHIGDLQGKQGGNETVNEKNKRHIIKGAFREREERAQGGKER